MSSSTTLGSRRRSTGSSELAAGNDRGRARRCCSAWTRGPWALPDGWHTDWDFAEASWPVPAVKLFAFVGEVAPRGGGTLLLPGSHHLVDRYRDTLDGRRGTGKQQWQLLLRRHPSLGDLLTAAGRPDLGRSAIGRSYDIDGAAVDVVELTGSPGDVVITHPHVFHTSSQHERRTEADAREGHRRRLRVP